MKNLTLIKSITGIFFLLQLSVSAIAGTSNGVSCKSGTTHKYSNGILKCYKKTTRVYRLGSMCPPLNHINNTVMDSRGRDTCLAVISGKRVSSAMTPPLFGYPAISRFKRVVRSRGVDKFIARTTKIKYQHPRGKVYFHNPKKGVKCPSGYSSKHRNGRLRCVQKIVKRATCDGIYHISIDRARNGRTDQCISKTPFGTMVGDYTIPEGYIGFSGRPSRHGWSLDSRRGRDKWVKTKYAYPIGR